MKKDIIQIVSYYQNKYNTNDPFVIADGLHIQVFQVPLGKLAGYYEYLKHHRCIFINSDIKDYNFKRLVMAHELGHAILDTKENCYFTMNHTYLLTSKIEIRANKFAINLLISDDELDEYHEYTVPQLSMLFGYDEELIKLRIGE